MINSEFNNFEDEVVILASLGHHIGEIAKDMNLSNNDVASIMRRNDLLVFDNGYFKRINISKE